MATSVEALLKLAPAAPEEPFVGPAFSRGCRATTSSLVFLLSAAHEGAMAQQVQRELAAQCLDHFKAAFPDGDRPLDVAALEHSHAALQLDGGKPAGLGLGGVALAGAVRFYVVALAAADVKAVVLAKDALNRSAGRASGAGAVLGEAMPQLPTVAERSWAMRLAVDLVNARLRSNVYIFCTGAPATTECEPPTIEVVTAWRFFEPPAAMTALADVSRAVTFEATPPAVAAAGGGTSASSGVISCQRDRCFYCRASALNAAVNLKPCAACRTVAYCSKECQAADWSGFHKKECKALRNNAPASGPPPTAASLGLLGDRREFLAAPGAERLGMASDMAGSGVYAEPAGAVQVMSFIGGTQEKPTLPLASMYLSEGGRTYMGHA